MPQLDFFTFPHQFLIFFLCFSYFYYFNLLVIFPLVWWMHFQWLFILDAIVVDMFIYEWFATWIVILECAVSFFFSKDIKKNFYPLVNKLFFSNIFLRFTNYRIITDTFKYYVTQEPKQDPFHHTTVQMEIYEKKFVTSMLLDEVFFENEKKSIPMTISNVKILNSTEIYLDNFSNFNTTKKLLKEKTTDLYPSSYYSTDELVSFETSKNKLDSFNTTAYAWLKVKTKLLLIEIISTIDLWEKSNLKLDGTYGYKFSIKLYYYTMLVVQSILLIIFHITLFFWRNFISFYKKYSTKIFNFLVKKTTYDNFRKKLKFVPDVFFYRNFDEFILSFHWKKPWLFDFHDLTLPSDWVKHNNLILSVILSIFALFIFLNTSLSFGAEKLMLCYFFLVVYFLLKEGINLAKTFFEKEADLSLNFLASLESYGSVLNEKFCNIQSFLKSYLLHRLKWTLLLNIVKFVKIKLFKNISLNIWKI